MFLASVINAKVNLFSGLVVGALVVAAAGQMKRCCRYSNNKCNSMQTSETDTRQNFSK